MKLIIMFCSIVLLILASCSGPVASGYSPGEQLGSACTIDKDCVVPIDFAIRSNCAFETRCVRNSCVVVCPDTYYDEKSTYRQIPTPCEGDSDCKCNSYLANDLKSCKCIENACYAVVYEE